MSTTPNTDESVDRFIENNPNLGLLISDDDVANDVARTLMSSVAEFLDQVEAERQQQFVATASGGGLDQLGELVNARRQPDEGDDAMRTRVRAGFGRATSETTIEDLAQITRTITGAGRSDIQIEPPANDVLVVIVRINSGILNDSPFGLTELGDFLSDVVPAYTLLRCERLVRSSSMDQTSHRRRTVGWAMGTEHLAAHPGKHE